MSAMDGRRVDPDDLLSARSEERYEVDEEHSDEEAELEDELDEEEEEWEEEFEDYEVEDDYEGLDRRRRREEWE